MFPEALLDELESLGERHGHPFKGAKKDQPNEALIELGDYKCTLPLGLAFVTLEGRLTCLGTSTILQQLST